MTRSSSLKFLGGLALLALAMTAQALMPSAAGSSMLIGAFLDAGHVPLFGLFALLVFWLSRWTVPGPGARHYAVAFALILIAGLGTEFIQKFGPRDAGWVDFERNLIGGVAGLLLAFGFSGARRSLRIPAILIAVVLAGSGLFEFGRVWLDYRGRDAAFPSLASFDAAWEPRFVHGHDAELTLVEADWADRRAGRIRFETAEYPSLAVHEPFPDWTGYDALEFVVYSELDEPVRLTLRIHDGRHDDTYLDRFNREIEVAPGLNHYRVPLADVAAGPRGRALDLGAVKGLAIFAERPSEPFEMQFDGLRLVRD